MRQRCLRHPTGLVTELLPSSLVGSLFVGSACLGRSAWRSASLGGDTFNRRISNKECPSKKVFWCRRSCSGQSHCRIIAHGHLDQHLVAGCRLLPIRARARARGRDRDRTRVTSQATSNQRYCRFVIVIVIEFPGSIRFRVSARRGSLRES